MFERFTESARRALFFARHEVTELGGTSIGPEHLLLGLLRNAGGFTSATLEHAGITYADTRREVAAQSAGLPRIGSSVETPFSERAKRTLEFSADESDRLQHASIGTEHILLALVRDAEAVGDDVFRAHGLTLEGLRANVAEYLVGAAAGVEPAGATSPAGASLARQEAIARIQGYLSELGSLSNGDERVLHLLGAIHMELGLLH